ncbi:MAG: DUF456 domain-containing protein [Deltaproteobacteria bacterium]|nr:DUF456 domain-containing protein [Deltaproteobacteria bacterium]
MDIPWAQVGLVAAHILLVLTTLGGLVGSFFPAFPGAVIIWGGALLHGLVTGWTPLGANTQLILTGLMALSAAGQFAISAAGAKRFGSSWWGITGAGIGMLVGTFMIPIPLLGSLLGAFLGALGFELAIAQPLAAKKAEAAGSAPPSGAGKGKEVGQAAKAGFGAALGAVLGMMAEVGIAFVMVGVVLTSAIF